MATGEIGGNLRFPIYNSDGSSFHGLVLNKSVYETVVMALGDKITGDVYYMDNKLTVTMGEYIEYKGVRYVLVNPPTVIREGMVSDNAELKGMTKYSFVFYHPMYMLSNFPFSDVAVTQDQKRYLSENKAFFWIGNLVDYVAKINKNLENTEWYCTISTNVPNSVRNIISDVLTFDKSTIADAFKTGYETWNVPYIVDVVEQDTQLYIEGKRFIVQFGLPTMDILDQNDEPFVFKFGQGVGLKNNSRTPKNNKIITRISGYGSEDNIQYGYPQIPYEGGDCQYPLYYGIVGGQKVQLIKHPFTRTHLMPSIFRETVNKKVNPMAVGYDPNIEIKDYYDADSSYENPIKPQEPSYDIHEFSDIKPELGDKRLVSVEPYDGKLDDSIPQSTFLALVDAFYSESDNKEEKEQISAFKTSFMSGSSASDEGETDTYKYKWSFSLDGIYKKVKYDSSGVNFEYTVLVGVPQAPEWDDTMDDDGNYVQSYFKVTLPRLNFDLYASAAVTQEMTINMRSGACLGCSFPIMVDWDDYKKNFYDADGNFAPDGSQRNLEKYPDSTSGQITVILQKETSTFGTLMPNTYQNPTAEDKFVILGISLPTTYITDAEARLDAEMKQYMRDNNTYYYEYPLKFDEYFLKMHTNILSQMKPNIIVRFEYAEEVHQLYIKQMSVKYDNKPLPTYDITLTDDVEIVLNSIGRAIDDLSKIRLGGAGGAQTTDANYLRKDIDDTANGTIRMIKGLQVGERFVTGLLGEGGVFRREEDGTTYIEADKLYVRMKAYFDTVEVRHFLHSAGNRVASCAGMKCSRVEYVKANGDVTQNAQEAALFRCYFRANDDGREVRNDFVVGDLAFCKETNASTDSIEQHGYWRAVVGRNTEGTLTNDGEGWIDLSASDCMSGSDVPIAQDDIVQLGNKTDTDRQGAIVEYVSGADSPSYQIYQGIDSYNLNGKNYVGLGYSTQTGRAYINVYGDAYIGDPNGSTYIQYDASTKQLNIKATINATSTIDGQTLEAYIKAHQDKGWTQQEIEELIVDTTSEDFKDINTAIETLEKQADGAIETWFYNGVPTLSNAPASSWNTTELREKHLGDLYYDNTTGIAYRFIKSNDTYIWNQLSDSAVAKALADAKRAQDTADGKRKVFVRQPTSSDSYDVGDLWVNATYGSTYHDDMLRCVTAKAEGTPFSINHWTLASRYTDDSSLNTFITTVFDPTIDGLENQIDGKIDSWYGTSDPSTSWTTTELKDYHVGDLWYNTGDKTLKRYTKSGDTYSWQRIEDKDAIAAADAASRAQDTADGKRTVFTSQPTTPYHVGDLWVNATYGSTYNNDVLRCKVERLSGNFSISDWQLASRYTDDSALTNFINSVFDPKITDLESQIDGKIETWFFNGAPSPWVLPESSWTTNEIKLQHVGDMYYDNKSGLAYRYMNTGGGVVTYSGENVTFNGENVTYGSSGASFSWSLIEDSATVRALADASKAQDTADGKRRVFVIQPVPPYDIGDMWVNATYGTQYANDLLRCVTAKPAGASFAITDWQLASKYTDDQALLDFKANAYVTQLTNGTLSSNINFATNSALSALSTADRASIDARAAEAHAATFDAIKQALNQGTLVDGGLVLTTLIGLRDQNNRIWSGISGAYNANARGGGIAAWYGGSMIDKEVYPYGDYAKSLFRMDGSGYVANGNISWDSTGLTQVSVSSVAASSITINGLNAATQSWVTSNFASKEWIGQNYISIAYFDRLFRAYNGNSFVQHNDVSSTINNIKAMFGFWTETYLTALGKNNSSSSSMSLSSLSDVNTSGASDGQALVYRSGTWVPEIVSGGGGATENWVYNNFLSLRGGAMITGNIITPENDEYGVIPAKNNYGQIGSSGRKYFRMYASTFYGELDGTVSPVTRGSFITENNEFNIVPQAYTRNDLHVNYRAANGNSCNKYINTYCIDDGNTNTICTITSSGASAGSDIRKKDVKEYFALSLYDIANAPLIRFTWKTMTDKTMQVGSIAQYWKVILPESVTEGADGYLFMNDAKVALACSISLARNVQDHEHRIAELERENENLRNEINKFKGE